MATYNAHTHVFTMSNAPKKFLHLYLPDVAAWAIDKISNTQPGSWALQQLLSLIGPAGKRYAGFLKIGKSRNQLEVFENLIAQYTDDPEIKFIALCLYMENFGAGISSSGYEGQLEEILYAKRQYPEQLRIFLGIDPRWKANGTELRCTVESYFEKKIDMGGGRQCNSFQGLKIYPSTGFYVFDQRLMETFEWAADQGVPVLSHCYYRGGIYNNDKSFLESNMNPFNPYTNNVHLPGKYLQSRKWKKWIWGINDSYNNKNTCSYFLDPSTYEPVIQYFQNQPKPLKISMAHYGGSEMMLISKGLKKPDAEEAALYGAFQLNWYEQVKNMMLKYKGVYTDIAYTLLDERVHPIIFQDLATPGLSDRILYGTDYFLTEKDRAEKQTYSTFKKHALAISYPTGGNAWQRISSENTDVFLGTRFNP